MWEHRNGILHNTSNLVTDLREDLVDQSIQNVYNMATSALSHTKDVYLLSIPLSRLLSRSMAYKETWLYKPTSNSVTVQSGSKGQTGTTQDANCFTSLATVSKIINNAGALFSGQVINN